MRLGLYSICAAMFPVTAIGQDTLAPTSLPIDASIHSYTILDVAPGSDRGDAARALSSHFGQALMDETATLNVRSSNGRSFQYEYAQRLVSPWVTPFVRMGSEPYEEVNVSLATDVLEGRVLGIDRTIVATGSDQPAAEAVFRQVEKAFGAPSLVHLMRTNLN